MKSKWTLRIYVGLLFLYAIYSYSQVDPNLFLSFKPFFWHFQNFMWSLGFEQRPLSALLYGSMVVALFSVYKSMHTFTKNQVIIALIVSVIALFPSYPALSYDVFNYAMNAKMVWKYQADPHQTTAANFTQDPWLQFMHNIHTPAPYARGWTYLSVPVGFVAQDNIKVNIVAFRLFMIGGLFLLWWLMTKFYTTNASNLALLFLNPLLLIETVSNVHNDVIMMSLEIGALGTGMHAFKKRSWRWGVLAFGLFAASISIKYASIMLLLGLIGSRFISLGGSNVLAHFALLVTGRSKQFLPWYLIWPLTFIPLTKEWIIKELLMWFSLSALLSYIPFLYWGEYSPRQQLQRALILWGLPPILFIISWVMGKVKRV